MKTMIDRSETRGFFDHGWLKTRHTFSFDDYYNPRRMGFGALRFLNDDTVAPGYGFGMHPYSNMEVVSIPLKGNLKHGEGPQTETTIGPGDIQVMSAGRGMSHCEYNESDTEELTFLQIWITPRDTDYPPVNANYDIRSQLKPNVFSVFISPQDDGVASVRQDAYMAMGMLDTDTLASYSLHAAGNGVYVFVISGSVMIGDICLNCRDGAGFWELNGPLGIHATTCSQVLLIEVPMLDR